MKPLKRLLFIVTVGILILSLAACGNNASTVLKEAVDEINSDESMHAALEGMYKVRAEARGDSTIVVIFKAEIESLASSEVSELISEQVADEFNVAVDVMRKAGISDPKVVLEFQDMSGVLLYTHVFP